MGYEDEKILKARKELKEQEKRAETVDVIEQENKEEIESGSVHIYETKVEFERRDIKEVGVSIVMPKGFERFSDDVLDIVYPMGNHPTHVFGGEDAHFTVGFNLTNNPVPNEHIKDFVKMASKMLERFGPKTKIIGTDSFSKEEDNFSSLEFVSNGLDTVVHNLMGYASIKGRLLIMTVSFPNKYKKRYVTIAKQILKSIEIIKGDDEDGDDHISKH